MEEALWIAAVGTSLSLKFLWSENQTLATEHEEHLRFGMIRRVQNDKHHFDIFSFSLYPNFSQVSLPTFHEGHGMDNTRSKIPTFFLQKKNDCVYMLTLQKITASYSDVHESEAQSRDHIPFLFNFSGFITITCFTGIIMGALSTEFAHLLFILFLLSALVFLLFIFRNNVSSSIAVSDSNRI
ncbi:hypothetical protein ACJX0J_015534 [Zea mays]